MEERYQKFCPITAEDFFWGMGHVLSRSYGSHPQVSAASSFAYQDSSQT